MSRLRTHQYRVVITDTHLYAKVFEAKSPRDALAQASIDTEGRRNWHKDWEIIGSGTPVFDPHPEVLDPDAPTKCYRLTRREYITQEIHVMANSPDEARTIARDACSDEFTEIASELDYDGDIEEVRS